MGMTANHLMSDPESWEIEWEKHCIVCGKSVLDGEGFCHMRVEGEMVAICCPLCFENFENNPKRYLSMRRVRRRQHCMTAQGWDRGARN